MNQGELAEALGISAAMVSKLKRRGMPVHSLSAARAWRLANLLPGYTKENRAITYGDPAEAVAALGPRALADWPGYGERLRAAYLALRPTAQERVRLDVRVWDRLCGWPGDPPKGAA